MLLILLPLQILSVTFFIKFYHFWWPWYSGYLVWGSSRCPLFDWYSNQFLWGSENHQVLKNGKAPVPDGITSTMLKHTAAQVAFPLALILNIALNEGKIPDDWKRANVVPIYKSGDIGSIKNYRPISFCSVVGKLLERVLLFLLGRSQCQCVQFRGASSRWVPVESGVPQGSVLVRFCSIFLF